MKQTLKELDKLYGTGELEVFKHSAKGYIQDFPRLLGHFDDRTCLDCGIQVTRPTYRATVTAKPICGFPRQEVREYQSQGYFLCYRPRGSELQVPTKVRFVHAHCLDQRYAEKIERMTMGPAWVPQTKGARA